MTDRQKIIVEFLSQAERYLVEHDSRVPFGRETSRPVMSWLHEMVHRFPADAPLAQ